MTAGATRSFWRAIRPKSKSVGASPSRFMVSPDGVPLRGRGPAIRRRPGRHSRLVELLDLFAEESQDAALGLEDGRPGHPESRRHVVAGKALVGRQPEGLPRLGLDPRPARAQATATISESNWSLRCSIRSSRACTL